MSYPGIRWLDILSFWIFPERVQAEPTNKRGQSDQLMRRLQLTSSRLKARVENSNRTAGPTLAMRPDVSSRTAQGMFKVVEALLDILKRSAITKARCDDQSSRRILSRDQ